MPDQNGIMTPEEIGNQGVNALLKLHAIKSQDEQLRQQALLFQQQLASGELEHKTKQLDFELKQSLARILGQKDVDPKTGQPKTMLLPQDKEVLGLLGFGNGAKPMDYLAPTQQGAAAEVAGGIRPSADTTTNALVGMRGQDLATSTALSGQASTAAIAGADRLQQQGQFESDMFGKLVSEGANPMLLSQGKVTDPATIAAAFEGRTPNARLNAFANVISASASQLKAEADAAYNHASASQLTAEAKNKFAPLKIMSETLGRLNVAYANQVAQGADTTAITNQIAQVSGGLSYLMHGLGFPPTQVAEPEKGWFSKMLNYVSGGRASKPGEVDQKALAAAMASGDLGAEVTVPNGATPAPGAEQPTPAAPPTTTVPPAATAPTSSLPLVDSKGAPVPYISPRQVAETRAKIPLIGSSGAAAHPPTQMPPPWTVLQMAANAFGRNPGAAEMPARQLLISSGMSREEVAKLRTAHDIELALMQRAIDLRRKYNSPTGE
jgi:hypothetical protein